HGSPSVKSARTVRRGSGEHKQRCAALRASVLRRRSAEADRLEQAREPIAHRTAHPPYRSPGELRRGRARHQMEARAELHRQHEIELVDVAADDQLLRGAADLLADAGEGLVVVRPAKMHRTRQPFDLEGLGHALRTAPGILLALDDELAGVADDGDLVE